MRHVLGSAIGLALVLGGCAVGPNASFVDSTNPADNDVIATAVTGFLHSEMPAARSTVIVEPSASGDQALLGLVRADLRRQGFAVAEPGSGAPYAEPVRLLVTPLAGGLVVRLDYGSGQAGTFFGRDASGRLQPSTPFVRRVAAQ